MRVKHENINEKEVHFHAIKWLQILIECLLEQGVDTIFGYPGGAILNVYDDCIVIRIKSDMY